MWKKFISNTSWIIGGKIFQMLISLLITSITVRYLGPENYGLINYTNAYVAFFSSICTLGLSGVIVNTMVNNRDEEGRIIGSAIVMRLVTSTVSMFAMFLLIKEVGNNDTLLIKVAMLQYVNVIFASFDTINYWYQSNLMSKVATIIQSSAYVVMSLYRVAILFLGKDVTWFAFAVSLDVIIVGISLLISYLKNGQKSLGFSIKWCRIMLSQSYPFILSGIMSTVYAQVDKIMIGNMMDQTSVGLYSTAIVITGLWGFIPVAFLDSSRPVVMAEKINSQIKYVRRLKQLYAFIIWLSFAYAIAMTIFSKFVILILYGEAYLPARSALVITVWYCAFSYLGSAKNVWMICENKMKYETILTFIGMICNIVLNYILIPVFGIVGAAIATLLTQVITNFLLMFIFKETRENAILIYESIILKDVINIETVKNRILQLLKR